METIYSPDLRAELTLDDHRCVRQVAHTEYFPSEAANARLAAGDYLRHIHRTLEIPAEQLQHLHQPVSFLDPREQEVRYRLADVKKFFRSATYCYYQTVHNTPVWDGGLTVTLKEAPFRITAADHRGHADLELDLPPKETIDRVRDALARINRAQGDLSPAVVGERAEPPRPRLAFSEAFAAVAPSPRKRAQANEWLDGARIKRGRFYVYRYQAKDRQPGVLDGKANGSTKDASVAVDLETTDRVPTLPLPAVPERIREGRHYLVAEIVFSLGRDLKTPFNWKALVEVETGAILWLRPMIAGVDALVFTYDPKTSTGDLTNTPDDASGILNPLRDPVTLSNLNSPMGGTQSLSGTNVSILDDDSPAIAPPTQPAMSNFDFDSRTNEFSAVNAYYHADNVFEVIESLGFDLATYFNGTSFPVHVDHRASSSDAPGATGVEVNAFCAGDAGSDGIGLVGFCLSDTTNTTNPLGRAVDKWVRRPVRPHSCWSVRDVTPQSVRPRPSGPEPFSPVRAHSRAHCADWIVRTGRPTILRLARGWPWATELAGAFRRQQTLPLTT